MKIEVARADELGEGYRHRIAEVLTQGFAEDFAFFSKDPGVLADAFAPMLILERFHIALVDGEPSAVAVVTEGEQECFEPDRHELQRVLGPIHGIISYRIIRSQFMGAYDGARDGSDGDCIRHDSAAASEQRRSHCADASALGAALRRVRAA